MKRIRNYFFISITSLTCLLGFFELEGKIAALVIAHQDYQPREYSVTKKLIEKADITILTVSDRAGIAVAGDGTYTKVDKTLKQLTLDDYDGIFFIGGPGAYTFLNNENSYDIIRKAAAAQKTLGAICYSPRILAKAGILKGKKATGWNGDNNLGSLFKKYDVTYIQNQVVIDGNIITATDPMAAEAFARGIIELLK